MNTRDKILQRIEACQMPSCDMPALDFARQRFDDRLTTFREMVERVGGTSIIEPEGTTSAALLDMLHIEGEVVSALPEFDMARNPDHVEECSSLGGRYTAIVRGAFGVAENGAVWLPQQMRHKAPIFAAEHLVVLLDKSAILDTMHDAMEDERLGTPGFGCFVAGLSKTADIEQALVIGAHGAMRLTVVLQ